MYEIHAILGLYPLEIFLGKMKQFLDLIIHQELIKNTYVLRDSIIFTSQKLGYKL
jgi:hypothetical protein